MGRKHKRTESIPPEDLLIQILMLFTNGERYFTPDTPLASIQNDRMSEESFSLIVLALELTLKVDIPEELVELSKISGTTIGEFARTASRLPMNRDSLQVARFVSYVNDQVNSPEEESEPGEKWKTAAEDRG